MHRRLPPLALAAVGLLGLTSGAVWATTSPPTTTTSPSTTTTSPSTTTSSTAPTSTSSTFRLGLTTTTTTARGATTTSSSSTTTTTTPHATPADATPTGVVGTVPQWALDQIAHFPVTPPGDTSALLHALAPLQPLGFTPSQAAVAGFGRFPIAGQARWSESFLEPRFAADGTFSFHHAIDIASPCGTPERAPDEGILTQGSDPGGGTTVEITEPDGTYMYMAHLSGYAAGTASGQHVHIGDLVGYVGQTGDATGCHLHLEIHPRGGEPVDPKPFVDAWYADALAEAPVLVAATQADHGLPSADAIAQGLSSLHP